MKRRTVIGIIVCIIVVIGIGIQLIPLPGRGQNPAVIQEPKWDSTQTAALVRRVCYDCHSNESRWPLYAYVAPASWLVYHDVTEGRSHLNFSEMNMPQLGAGEMAAAIQSGKMPPWQYLLLHPEARLTSAEKQQLITGLQNSLP